MNVPIVAAGGEGKDIISGGNRRMIRAAVFIVYHNEEKTLVTFHDANDTERTLVKPHVNHHLSAGFYHVGGR